MNQMEVLAKLIVIIDEHKPTPHQVLSSNRNKFKEIRWRLYYEMREAGLSWQRIAWLLGKNQFTIRSNVRQYRKRYLKKT